MEFGLSCPEFLGLSSLKLVPVAILLMTDASELSRLSLLVTLGCFSEC